MHMGRHAEPALEPHTQQYLSVQGYPYMLTAQLWLVDLHHFINHFPCLRVLRDPTPATLVFEAHLHPQSCNMLCGASSDT